MRILADILTAPLANHHETKISLVADSPAVSGWAKPANFLRISLLTTVMQGTFSAAEKQGARQCVWNWTWARVPLNDSGYVCFSSANS
jgi:hypothetical protein